MAPASDKLELRGIKFAFVDQAGNLSAAVPSFHPLSPEYPLPARVSATYPQTALVNSTMVSILCCFYMKVPPTPPWITVRAFLVDEAGKDLGKQFVAPTPFLIQRGTFSTNNMVEGFLPFQADLSAVFAEPQKVGFADVHVRWEWFEGRPEQAKPWQELTTSAFSFYLTFDKPSLPWGMGMTALGSVAGAYPPSIVAISHTCRWASGAYKQGDVAAKVLLGLTGATSFAYNTASSYTTYPHDSNGIPDFSGADSRAVFRAAGMYEHLQGFSGPGHKVNCMDMALFMLLLANAAGCGLKIGILANKASPSSGFALNAHKPLKGSIVSGDVFVYHVVAYIGEAFTDTEAFVYDPCLQLMLTSHINGGYAVGMRLDGYRNALAVHPEDCQPYDSLDLMKIQLS